jgi:ribosomal protein S18 acetylase RimI-like enzyme
MQIGFRAAEETDIEWLVGAMREFNTIDDYGFDAGIARSALQRFLSDSSLGGLWLIESEGKSIGYVVLSFGYSFEFHGRDAFVDELFIEADYRGRGIGRQAIQFIEEQCKSSGVNALHLEVERTNLAAQALYKKTGFQDHDRFLMTKWISK